ncbi:MAG: ribonuclease III [Aestuariivirga sp.]
MARKGVSFSALEDILNHHFAAPDLLQAALTHGSRIGKGPDYQRLEFLGDRVLSLVVAEALFKTYPDEAEGSLAARLSLLVRGETCAKVGLELGIQDFVILGEKEKRKGVQESSSVLGDVVEALIGALYLDGGMDAARAMIEHGWAERLKQSPASLKDAKTFVQEWALGKAFPLPSYSVVSRSGPEHAPVFTIALTVGALAGAEAQGNSKQAAEMAAAQVFIERERLR